MVSPVPMAYAYGADPRTGHSDNDGRTHMSQRRTYPENLGVGVCNDIVHTSLA